jgi:hypothetical protein
VIIQILLIVIMSIFALVFFLFTLTSVLITGQYNVKKYFSSLVISLKLHALNNHSLAGRFILTSQTIKFIWYKGSYWAQVKGDSSIEMYKVLTYKTLKCKNAIRCKKIDLMFVPKSFCNNRIEYGDLLHIPSFLLDHLSSK